MTNNSYPNWYLEGKDHIWHPYTHSSYSVLPLPVKRTEGVRIYLEDGRELIDGISAWWTMCHGYNDPYILSCVNAQLNKMPHIMFAGLAHAESYRLASRIIKIAPKGLNRVFFSEAGSIGMEISIKMAIQYWINKGIKEKNKFIHFKHGYHGDTLGTMSIGDPSGMHNIFHDYLHQNYCLTIPTNDHEFAKFEEFLIKHQEKLAALVIEPLVQAPGGMKFHSKENLAKIHELSKKHNLLFIADEIATCFGRTGEMFACLEADITPDIMAIGKGLTGGTLPLTATLVTEQVYECFNENGFKNTFMHGTTFMANPLACAAANASLDLFEKNDLLKKVRNIEQQLQNNLKKCLDIPGVEEVRVKGAIGVVQFDTNKFSIFELRKKFVEKGVWLRPIENIIYTMPPFIISNEDLSQITTSIYEVLSKYND